MKFPRLNRDPDPADPSAAGGGGDPAPADPAAAPAAPVVKPDVTPVPTDPGTQKVTIPAVADPVSQPIDKEGFLKTIPVEYKDKDYLKDVQSFEQLYKKLDGAQELIGKRPGGIPATDASEEEKASFYKSWGRPDKAEEYTSPEIKLPDGVEKNTELDAFAKDLFHKAGLNQDQVNIIQGGYEQKVLEMGAAAAPDQDALNKEFDVMTDKLFADRKDAILKNGNLLLVENTPEELKEAVAKLDNKSLLIMSAVLDSVREKYIAEDVMPVGGDPVDQTATVNELRQQARDLMAKPEYTSKSEKGHADVKQQVDDIYARIGRMEARTK